MTTSKIFELIFLLLAFTYSTNAQLKIGYYYQTCPKAEAVVKQVMDEVMAVAPGLSGPLLRMHFHDCFVRAIVSCINAQGCDGSVLIDSPTQQSEKYAIPNLTLRGYQIIDRVKTALEKECPGVVSCADIIAIVARDVTAATLGPYYEVETGRRDGNVSNVNEPIGNLLPPFANISVLIAGFQAKGLNVKDLVVLSGGHTIGTSHCSSFDSRLYNFTGKGNTADSDPTLDSEYVPKLKAKCKQGDQTTLVEMDPGSVRTFDRAYFNLVAKRRGLFQSDAALLDNKETREYLLKTSTATFFKDFGESMVNMGRVGVLTRQAGNIRKVCSKFI